MAAKSLLEQELDQLYKKVAVGQERGEKIGKVRRVVAYSLKTIAAGGSLFVATGLLPSWHQAVGIAILVAVFVDTISSNHKILLAEVEAGYAFRSLRSRIKGDFNRAASPLYERLKSGDTTVEPLIEDLMNKAHIALSSGIGEIEKLLEKADISALKSLSLDQERSDLSKI